MTAVLCFASLLRSRFLAWHATLPPKKRWGRCVTSQKTAAKETNVYMDNMKLVSHWFSQRQCLAFATSGVPVKPSMPLLLHREPHIPTLKVQVLYPRSYFGIEFYWHMWQFSTSTIIHCQVCNIAPSQPLVLPVTVQDVAYPPRGRGLLPNIYKLYEHTNMVLWRVWFSGSVLWESYGIEIRQLWSRIL